MMTGAANPQFLRKLLGFEDLEFLSLDAAEQGGLTSLRGLPRALRVLAEDILFRLDADAAEVQIAALRNRDQSTPVTFAPSRALLQDFMGIPLMTDMASMRDQLHEEGIDPEKLNPVIPVDFVVDHSLTVMHAGSDNALALNRRVEMERNLERFRFIKWCQSSFRNFRVIPPGRGIMHQVNLEWLSTVVRVMDVDGRKIARPDTMIGTDSHTTMVNALGVLGWGVGGLEAEMVMLGMPIVMPPPPVIGIELSGRMRRGATATDLVLHMTEMLRGIGVVGAFVEFFGPGVAGLPLADRATIANMSPEFGATCSYFPIDRATIDYLAMTGRKKAHLELVEAYAKEQGIWQTAKGDAAPAHFDAIHIFDLDKVEPSMAGPVRPDERVRLSSVPMSFEKRMQQLDLDPTAKDDATPRLGHGAVVIAAITSCTNTSNPAVMMAAGLLARNAARKGMKPKAWVKTSLSPGSRVVTDYLTAAGLTDYLDALGFQNVGYGCATCNGNSGPLARDISEAIVEENLCTVAVLSGNRNFEGRIHPEIKAAYLASPPLVIVAALAGTVLRDFGEEPIGEDGNGDAVHLADIWPSEQEIAGHVARFVTSDRFAQVYEKGMETTQAWSHLEAPDTALFPWDEGSLFIRRSPFAGFGKEVTGILEGCKPLLVLGDAVTTDHISPNGAIRPESPAGRYLIEQGTAPGRLGNFGARRGNPDVCLRGMFDNSLLENELLAGERGNRTIRLEAGRVETSSVFDAAMRYQEEQTPLLIVAGRNYGAGSSRDWAAKGLRLLGVVAVLAESFERIHRTNLVGMGILPLTFADGADRTVLDLSAADCVDIRLRTGQLVPQAEVDIEVRRPDGERRRVTATLQLFSNDEVIMLGEGGMLPSIVQGFTNRQAA
ncbi:aconitate hydratase AcnA [Georhizobium sp. MAB10]|uniref:aconitate hydratase AcnA n=1 Tax=Georhizobium sp. MAB10 TaxID=3028319 RepID=UPI003855C5EC